MLDRLPAGWLPAKAVRLEDLAEDRLFRYGVQLGEAGYFWEAHAVWEELWRAVPAQSAESHLLRALIQRAAAALKRELGNPAGATKLLAKANASLDQARALARAAHDPELRITVLNAVVRRVLE